MSEEPTPEAKKPPRADVPRYYRVACRFFDDEKVRRWPDWAKLFALYLLTSKHRNLEGLFVLPPNYIAADLRWTLKRVMTGLEFLSKEEFLLFDLETNLLLLKNALRYQQPDSPNVLKGVLGRLRNLPDNPQMFKEFARLAKQHCYRSGLTAHAQSFPVLLCKEFNIQVP